MNRLTGIAATDAVVRRITTVQRSDHTSGGNAEAIRIGDAVVVQAWQH
ncbi:MAG: hypothetical protein GY924_10800 [Planctomycetaceae bacterium]|nr:hypothetical protein [Planctomycetaceae bacterium]